MSMLRDAVSSAVQNDRLLVLSAGVFCVDCLVRAVLSLTVSSLSLVLFPPVVTVVTFGLASARVGEDRVGTTAGWVRLAGLLTVIGVVGHAGAVLFGGGLFVLVDTPVRALLYWLGVELLASPLVGVVLPVLGVALGTALAWAVPALVAADIGAGTPPRTALARVLGAVTDTPRTVLSVGLANVLVVATAVAAVGASFLLASVLLRTVWGFALALVLGLLLGGMVSLAVAGSASALGQTRLDETPNEPDATAVSRRPVARFALVVVLVVSLATVAGMVRANDLRPVETDSEPLGEDPQAIYETALSNTFDGNHAVVTYPHLSEDDYWVNETYDLQQRRFRIGDESGYSEYWTVGETSAQSDSFAVGVLQLGHSGERRLVPGLNPAYVDGYDYGEELPATERPVGWEVVDRGETIILESRNASAILRAEGLPPRHLAETRHAWLRATVDAETGTLRSLEYSYNVTLDDGDTPSESVGRERWEFETGTTIERPPDAEPPSLEQRVWKLLIY